MHYLKLIAIIFVLLLTPLSLQATNDNAEDNTDKNKDDAISEQHSSPMSSSEDKAEPQTNSSFDIVRDTISDTKDDATLLPEIIVQENKGYPKLKNDMAAAGSVLLQADLDDAGESLPEVLDQQAGVRVSKMGGPASFSTLSIRGSTSDQVLVVIDEIPLNTSGGGSVDLSRILLGNISRVEIYRGAVPITFGANAIGGVLSISTKSGKKRELTFGLGAGSYGARNAKVFYAEPSKNWDFALGLDYSGWDGGFNYTNDNGTRFDESDDRRVSRQNNHYNQLNLMTKARIRLGEKWRITLMDWLFVKEQGLAGLGLFETSESAYKIADNLFALKIDGFDLLGRFDFKTVMSFRYSWSKVLDPLGEIGVGSNSSSNVLVPAINSTAKIRIFNWWDAQLQFGYSFEQFTPSENGLSAPKSYRNNISAGVQTGFHVEVLDLVILPSARIQWYNSELMDNSSITSKVANLSSNQAEWGARLAIVNESIPDTKLSISGGRAVRMPSLFELFGNTGKVLGNPKLRAEMSYSADAGIVYESSMLPNNFRLRFEAFGYFSEIRNLIQFVQTAQNVAVAENVDSVQIWGFETGIKANLFGHLSLTGNYTLLKSKNTSSIAARQGKVLPNRPASKWYYRIEGYSGKFTGFDNISLYFENEWIAGNYLDNANLVAVSERLYLNAGFSLSLHKQIAKLSFSANNLTNEQTLDYTGYPIAGRTYNIMLSVKAL